MKRFSIGKLFLGTLAYCVINTLFLASCAKDNSQAEQPGRTTTGRTIRKEVTVQVAPMQGTEGEGTTRATTEVPLSEDEARIHSLWVLQFDGTEAGSVLIKKTEVDVSEINPVTGAFFFDFEELAGGGDSQVYLLANFYTEGDDIFNNTFGFDGLVENSTGLSEFSGLCYTDRNLGEDEMKSDGLPMVALHSFNVAAANPAPFKLKSLLAKVMFSFDTTTDFPLREPYFMLCNIAGGTPIVEIPPRDAAFRPIGLSYEDADFDIVVPTVYYVSENLSGRMSGITKDSDRGGKEGVDVPKNAMYVQLMDRETANAVFNFYLGDGTPQDFNVVRHHQYNMHVTLSGLSTTDKRVELQTANCYIVNTYNGAYSFHATVMGNGAVTPAAGANAPEILPTTLKPASAKVLWEQSDPAGTTTPGDVVKNVSLSSDGLYINFTTGTKPGNAVIGAFDDAGTLIWSWHIWHPETNPSDVECHTTANGGRDFKMMDRNLGAFNNNINDVKAYGLLYQWGRKDPFPNATKVTYDEYDSDSPGYEDTGGVATFRGVVTENGYSFAAVQTSTGITVQGGALTPMNFYWSENGDTNWLQSLNDNLWGTPYTNSSVSPNPDLGSKSIYDPCPYGYRVPPQDTWSQATDANSTWATNGYQLGVGTGSTPAKYFYPAAGVRWGDSDVGKLASVGSIGSFWSSSPYSYGDSGGGYLNFNAGYVGPEDFNYRASGMSVRCMKEPD